MTGTLSVSQGFELSDNEDLDSATSGETFTSRTGLSFTLDSQTRTEVFRFSLGTAMVGDFGGGADDDFEIENSNAALEYTRQGANSRLRFAGRYRESDLDDNVLTFGPSNTLIIDGGSTEVLDLEARLETGLSGPFGLDVRSRYRKEDYFNTTDTDLINNERISLDALANFRVNPALTARVRAGIARTNEYGIAPDEIDDTYFGVGVAARTAGGLSVTGDVLYDRTEDLSGSDDGVGVDISVSRSLATGSAGLNFSSRVISDGRRTSASANRTFNHSTGSLSFSLGVVDQEGDSSIRPSASVTYTQSRPQGDLSASLSHNPSIDGPAVYGNTRISVDFAQGINANSGWSAGLSYASVDQLNGPDDENRTTARLTYTRSITRDWQMNTGIAHTRNFESGTTESSNTLFFNIRRDFTFGF